MARRRGPPGSSRGPRAPPGSPPPGPPGPPRATTRPRSRRPPPRPPTPPRRARSSAPTAGRPTTRPASTAPAARRSSPRSAAATDAGRRRAAHVGAASRRSPSLGAVGAIAVLGVLAFVFLLQRGVDAVLEKQHDNGCRSTSPSSASPSVSDYVAPSVNIGSHLASVDPHAGPQLPNRPHRVPRPAGRRQRRDGLVGRRRRHRLLSDGKGGQFDPPGRPTTRWSCTSRAPRRSTQRRHARRGPEDRKTITARPTHSTHHHDVNRNPPGRRTAT